MNDALGWSFSAGSLFGIPIRVHWTLLAMTLGWVLTSPDPRTMGWRSAVCVVGCLTVLVHELGHAFAAKGVGGTAHKIVLWPLGGLAYTSHSGRGSDRQRLIDDIKVVLGGPMTHIPLAILFARLLVFQGEPWSWQLLHPTEHWSTQIDGFWPFLCLYALKIQVWLFLFNLFLPVYPLDGGRLLVDLMLFGFRRETVAVTIITLSVISGLALIPLGHPFLVIWAFFEVYQLYTFYKRKELAHHPLFARVPQLSTGTPRKPGGSVVLQFRKPEKKAPTVTEEQRQCPYCQRMLPRHAKMCGPCERILPEL